MIVLTVHLPRCHILRLKMHQIEFGLALRPRPHAGGAPHPLQLDLKGPTSRGREGEGGQGSGGEGRVFSLHLSIRGLRKGPGKFLMGSWKVLEKSWIFCQ